MQLPPSTIYLKRLLVQAFLQIAPRGRITRSMRCTQICAPRMFLRFVPAIRDVGCMMCFRMKSLCPYSVHSRTIPSMWPMHMRLPTKQVSHASLLCACCAVGVAYHVWSAPAIFYPFQQHFHEFWFRVKKQRTQKQRKAKFWKSGIPTSAGFDCIAGLWNCSFSTIFFQTFEEDWFEKIFHWDSDK